MKTTPEVMRKGEQESLEKLIGGTDLQLLVRVVAGLRDQRLILGAEDHVMSREFPLRAESAKDHFMHAERYTHFLEVLTEIEDWTRNADMEFTVQKISPTQLQDCERGFEPPKPVS